MIHVPPRRSAARTLVRPLAALAAALAIVAAALLPTAAASAAEIPGAIHSVTTDKTSYGYTERLKLTFDWSVPDTAVAGDTFTLALPPELKAVSLAKFALLAADGSVVANAQWSGNAVVFTLTDYADTHDGVGGSGFLTVQWDHTQTPETSAPIVLEFESNAVEVIIGDKPTPQPPCTTDCPPVPPTPTTRSLAKSGGWTDGAFEGTRDESSNIAWRISLPGNETGFEGPIEVVDTPAAGSIIECSTIELTTQLTLEGSAAKSPVDPTRYSVECSPTTFTVVLDSIAPTEFISITYKGTITNQLSGTYANHVEVTIAGVTTIKDTVIKRTDAGGIGGGVQSVSVGDYVWLDEDRDGIQDAEEPGIPGVTLVLTGPGGAPVTDVTGAPVGPTVTDADGRYLFANLPVLPAGQHYAVTIDADASAEALEGLEPTKPGAGSDPAEDSSTESAESTDLTTNGAQDLTLDFGFVTPELPTLPEGPEDPETPTLPAPPADGDRLALTGSEVPMPFALGALVLLLGGAATLLIARTRQR
ncbi:SdrD B-like domain-containing protein [Salinibacterium soli]|uniref:SdrD B-like domain-containing protein n=1 Tax=Antiquaquibacter soli TaxID=3064523 RepID=A0ABT9BNF3_9MICO|nr:SdrD B-like domain-containing protein [Protaetiibacter sp. WY-16]MDO7882571.1 SdrD B-like domain-containing protein [Protaetiibacter sp. WY-16]